MSDVVESMRKIEQLETQKLFNLDEKDRDAIVIQETIYLGKIDGKDLFRLAEQDNRDNYTAIIYKYFDGNAELQGVKNVRNDGDKQWVYLGEEWEELRDEIDRNESQLEEEIEEMLSVLGISKEDVEDITEVDLNQKIKDKELNEDKDEEEQEQEESKEDDEEKDNPDQTSKYGNVLNEVDTSRKIDEKGTTLGQALGLEKYGYTSLKIVHADNVSDIRDADGKRLKAGTKKLAILGVREVDGKQVVERVPEDILDYYQGSNNESIRFGSNGEVEENAGTYERFVNPRTNRGITIERSEMETKVFYQSGIGRDDNTAVMERVEDSHTGLISVDTKRIFNSNHGMYHQDKINEEMDQHEEDKGEKIDQANADGDLNTASGHIHEIDVTSEIPYEGRMMSVKEVAQMPRFKVSPEHFVELYNSNANAFKGKKEIDMYELYNKIEDAINAELERPGNR